MAQQQTFISHRPGDWKSKIKVSAGWVSSEASPCCVDGRFFPVSSCGHPSVCVCVLISSSYKDTSQTGSGPPLLTSFYLNYRCIDPVSKQSHSEGLGLQHTNIGGHNETHNRFFLSKRVSFSHLFSSPDIDLRFPIFPSLSRDLATSRPLD